MRRILVLAALAAFILTTHHHPHWAFASAVAKSDDPAQADASYSMESPSSSADPAESDLANGHSSNGHSSTDHPSDHPSSDHPSDHPSSDHPSSDHPSEHPSDHPSSDHPSSDHPSSALGDPSLFWGDLTPRAADACPHSTDGAHHHAAPGLAGPELFPTPHDCGGFHGEQMMAAALFDTNLPVELKSWPVYLAKR